MHKKYAKLNHKDHSSRRRHLKNRETDDSALEIIKAPQNSSNELGKKFGFGDCEVKEKFKSNKEKHKRKREEVKSNGKSRLEKKSFHDISEVQDLVVDKSVNKSKKKEKRDKERLNKIEKYLEGLNKASSRKLLHKRSLSLESTKSFLKNPEKHIRREKTFHDKGIRDISTNSRIDAKKPQLPPTKDKSGKHKKHKHKENRKRESSKEKNTKDNQKTVLYCEVELQSPFVQEKKSYNLEHLYPQGSNETKEQSSRKRSSSRDNSAQSRFEPISKDSPKHFKDKKVIPIKFSPRKSKLKTDLRSHKDQRSTASLGPYGKYFVFDKTSRNEKETTRRKKKKRRKEDSRTKTSRNERSGEPKDENIQPINTKKNQEKNNSNSDQYKAKIEDDIKSYFSKIQSLIDKKLDYILGNSKNSKESKSNSVENENEAADKTKNKKEKKAELKEAEQARDRSHSKRRKGERYRSVEEEKREKRLEEEPKMKHSEEEKKANRQSRRIRYLEASNVSLKRERYPSEDSRIYRRRQSPLQHRPYENHPSVLPPLESRRSNKKVRQHRRYNSPYDDYSTHKMSPDRLIKMLEHPSTFSVQSTTSLVKEKCVSEVKRRPNDTQTSPNELECYQKRDRSLSKRKPIPDENNLKVDVLDGNHAQKLKKREAESPITLSKTALVQEKLISRPGDSQSDLHRDEQRHYKRSRSSFRRSGIPGEDGFEETEPPYLQEKRFKKRMRQLMNLECKTVSIVGIPSQIRESTIFNETQTTTSLNAINPTEDIMEQKKKSKRFKLYYKYSAADNKCHQESDKSSEGKKSIVSDSYRVVSDPSDHNLEVWEDNEETSKNVHKESDPDLAKILFVMKKEKAHKHSGDVTRYPVEHVPKKYRKHGDSPKTITLNNIVEEPSNISIVIRANDSPPLLKEDLNCTFFKTLKSSSSDCNLELLKKSTLGHKHRHSDKPLKNDTRPKSPSKKGHEREEVKRDKKFRCEEKRGINKKITKVDSHHKVKKKNRDMYNYNSKSDINISYDSLRKLKFSKGKHKPDAPSHFREQLRQLLPELFLRKSSPERKSIDLIIKEEIREIIREIPRKVIREMSFTEESKQTGKPATKPDEKEEKDSKELNENPKNPNIAEKTHCSKKMKDSYEIDSKEANEVQNIEETTYSSKHIKVSHKMDPKESDDKTKIQNLDEKTYCSKKIGTQAITRIPSLIKGYTGTTPPEVSKFETIESHNSMVNQDETPENEAEEQGEKNLMDAATEVEVPDKAMIVLENKKSQTPSYLETLTVVGICDPTKQYKHPKKVSIGDNLKRCQIIDPFTDAKIGSTCKSTRPIINLENNQFPPIQRQRSTTSDEKTVKFENREKSPARKVLVLDRRPATADEKRKEPPNSPLDKFRQRPTKPTLTMSTNIVTIDTSEIYNTQAEDVKNYQDQSLNKQATFKRSRVKENLTSKSSMSLNDVDMESKIGSLVRVDRYSNVQKVNLNSNSNSRSLDRYTTKSLISDNPHGSRLFLTKNFDPKMNTYQRRKMYDENIRKKMKKKYGSQNEMGPRIFEVRYLTLEKGNLNEGVDTNESLTAVVNQKCFSRLPTYNTKTNKAKLRTKSSKASTKLKRNFPKNKEDACKFSGRDIFAPIVSDVDQLNKFRRKAFPEKTVEEIFVKQKRSTFDKEETSLASKEEVVSTEQACKTSGSDSENTNQNFKDLIDCLYNSIITYCDTKFKMPQKPSPEQNAPKSPPVTEKSYVIFPKPSNETISTTNGPFKKNSSSEGNVSNEEKQSKRPTNLICSHLSCPVLAGSTSSFDYLYEDGPIELNKDAVLLHFKKPMKTILGYALNNTNRINFPKKEDQISNSLSESEESGYSSNYSKKCMSVCSFFKKPSIVNLFKPVKKLETCLQSTSSLLDSKSGPNLREYNIMNQKCIEYAEKVRSQTQNKGQPEETFREIPLDVLLLCRKSSTLLSDFNSNCSLCKKFSNSDLPDITEADELSYNIENVDQGNSSLKGDNLTEEDKTTETLLQGGVLEETLFFYKDIDHRHSVEMITIQTSQTNLASDNTSLLIKETIQCPVVLSMTNLNSCSLTVIDESSTNDNSFCFGSKQNENMSSNHINLNHISNSDLKSPTQTETDCKSDVSSICGFRCSNSKFMAKRFFDNLLKVYEKEIHVTNKLFQDDDFFINVLLESVKSGGMPKPKLKKLIKGKIKNCIGNMFCPKTCKPSGHTDTQRTCSSNNNHQQNLQILAGDARKYFSMFVQAVKTNKDINDEIKICGLLKLLERIEEGDFAILRKKEEVDFEEEIKEQVKEAFANIYQMSVKEARKRKRSLTTDDLKLIRTFVSKYRIGLLSKTDLIATYIGRGVLKTEGHLKAAVTYLIQQNKTKDIDLKDFDQHCKILAKCSG